MKRHRHVRRYEIKRRKHTIPNAIVDPFDCVFYSYFQGSWKIEAFSLCVFTSTKSPRGPPWNEGHQPKVRHETSVLEVPAQEQHEHSFYSSSTNTFITCSLYTVRRYRTSPGTPDLRYMEWNVAGHARSTGDPSQQGLLPEVYHTASTGRCAHLHDRVLNKPMNYQQRTDPRSCVWVVYI